MTPYQIAQQRIAKNKASKEKDLNLSNLQLESIPPEIAELQHLEVLDLSSNQISDLEPLATLTNLIGLSLLQNQISDLQHLVNLTSLTDIYLHNNEILDLQPLASLTNLTSLGLVNNQISDLQPLTSLKNLRSLYLFVNKISELQPLASLTNLTELHLDANKVIDLQPLTSLTNLTLLNLASNQISDLQPLASLKNLTRLSLWKNRIPNIQPLANLANLEKLDCRNNLIETLPHWAVEKKWDIKWTDDYTEEKEKKKYINLYNNPIKNIDTDFVKKGKKAILGWLKEEKKQAKGGKEGSVAVYEAKVMILGEIGSGKTSLVKRLLNKNEDITLHNTTHGIQISDWRYTKNLSGGFEPPDRLTTNAPEYCVHLWDFGGQNIQWQTHNLFFTVNCVYVYMYNNRVTEKQDEIKIRRRLDLIKRTMNPNNKIILVLNEQPDTKSNNLSIDNLKQDYGLLFHTINLKNNNTGLAELEAILKDAVAHLPYIGGRKLRVEYEMQQELAKIVEKRKKTKQALYITRQDFRELFVKKGIKELERQNTLMQWLHELGVIQHFENNDVLCEKVFLDPQWLTEGIHDFLANLPETAKGRFEEKEIREFFKKKCSPYEDISSSLATIMKEFELCYSEDNSYIVPANLPQIKTTYEWNETENYRLIYAYKSMPEGVFWRLVVRLASRQLLWNNIVWREGAVFQYQEAQAEVIESNPYLQEGTITVRLRGKQTDRQYLSGLIYKELQNIGEKYYHLTENKLEPTLQFVCNCRNCSKINLVKEKDKVDLYEWNFIQKSIIQKSFEGICRKNLYKVDIADLLVQSFDVTNKELDFLRIQVADNQGFEREFIGEFGEKMHKEKHKVQEISELLPNKYLQKRKTMATKNGVFVSYSHKDKEWHDKLVTFLGSLEHYNTYADTDIKYWSDTQIESGTKWFEEIQKAIDNARIVIFIVSSDFMNSNFIKKHEIPPIFEKAEKEGTIMLQLFVRSAPPHPFLKQYQGVEGTTPQNYLAKMDNNKQEEILSNLIEFIAKKFGYEG